MGNKKIALKVENISIRFNLSKEKVDNLKELIIKKLKGQKIHFNEFWALKNINFELQKGDRLGILGLNGAGKSTLFNAICGSFMVDEGHIFLDDMDITYSNCRCVQTNDRYSKKIRPHCSNDRIGRRL